MSCLLLAATLALGFDPQSTPAAPPPGAPTTPQGQAAMSHLDGTWLVIYAEKDGQTLSNKQNETVTIHGNVLTWNKDGQEHRVNLQFGAHHHLMATPAHAEHAAKSQANTAEHQPTATGERSGQAPTRTAAKQGEAGQAAPAGDQSNQRPGIVLPAHIPGQLPGGAAATRESAAAGQSQAEQQGGAHHGVYIHANEFLCLALEQGFEGEQHKPAATGVAKPGTLGASTQPAAQAARPGQTGANAQQGTTPNTNQGTAQPATAQRGQPGNTPQGTAGTSQAKNEQPGTAGTARTANYAADARSAGNMQQSGFVLILRREGVQQQPVKGK